MSRVKKFKEYRNSLQNNSEDVFESQPIDINQDIDDERLYNEKPSTESLSTLSVSYDEIMGAVKKVDEENDKERKQKIRINYKKTLMIAGITLGCIAVVVGLVFLGIYLFK